MSRKKSKESDAEKDNPKTADNPDEPTFRYSLELVATIAAHFADGKTDDRAAVERAISLLDEVSKTIERKTLLLRAHAAAEREAEGIPKHLDFETGIRRITRNARTTEANKAFRDYLRLHLRLSDLGRPSQLTDEQVKAVLEPLTNREASVAEEARIEKIMARDRSTGFTRHGLLSLRQDRDCLQESFVRRYQNSKKGKSGAAAKKAKKVVVTKLKAKK